MRSGVSNRNKFLREIHCADCPEVYRLDKDTRMETVSCPNCGGRRGMYVDQNGIPYRRTVDNNDWFFNLDGSPNFTPQEEDHRRMIEEGIQAWTRRRDDTRNNNRYYYDSGQMEPGQIRPIEPGQTYSVSDYEEEANRRDRERVAQEFGFAPAVSDRPNLANYPGAGST